MKRFLLLALVPGVLASCGGQTTQATEAASEKVVLSQVPHETEAADKAQDVSSSRLQAQAVYWNTVDIELVKPDYNWALNYNTGVGVVNLWSYDPSADRDQQWQQISYDNGNYFLLKRTGTNLCLNIHRAYAKNGQPVNVWTCNPNDIDQQWQSTYTGGPNAQAIVRAKGTNFCLNVYGRRNGAPATVWTCNQNDADQIWAIHVHS